MRKGAILIYGSALATADANIRLVVGDWTVTGTAAAAQLVGGNVDITLNAANSALVFSSEYANYAASGDLITLR